MRHSPCVGVCQLDDATGWCHGCGRTGDEVARWLGLSEDERLAVWETLPQRLDVLGVGVRLLPWTRAEIGSWVQQTLSKGSGTWSAGGSGALAEYFVRDGERPDVDANEDRIEARLPELRFRLNLHDKMRAFGFAEDGAVVLGLPKARATLSGASTLTALGEDVNAIDPLHRGHMLFDLGAGDRSSRLCIRTNDSDLISTLNSLIGQPWPGVLQDATKHLLSSSPHRVVETTQARIEILTTNLRGGEQPPAAALCLPPLQEGGEAPSNRMLPDFALPVAVYSPRAG
jgi:predicted Fe-S protein YdhL (DUF1289 family)